MKTICFFGGDFNLKGGAERVATVIANELSQSGHSVKLLSLSGGLSPFFHTNPAIEKHQLFSEQISFTRNCLVVVARLRKFVRENRIDVLIDVESILAIFSLPALAGTRIRHICWEQLNYKNDLGRPVRRVARHLAAIFSDDVVTLTERDKVVWKTRTWMRARITAIFNPIPFDVPAHHRSHANQVVLAVGRLTHVKGFDMLLKAWAIVAPRMSSGWRLRIVGDGEDKHALENMITDFEIADTVEFVPPTDQISKHYFESAFYCLSSRYEGLPMVLIEAQAHGLPCIAFDCETGPREIILDSQTGKLVAPDNCAELAREILSFMRNEKMREEFSVKAVQNSTLFAKEKIVKQWLALIG